MSWNGMGFFNNVPKILKNVGKIKILWHFEICKILKYQNTKSDSIVFLGGVTRSKFYTCSSKKRICQKFLWGLSDPSFWSPPVYMNNGQKYKYTNCPSKHLPLNRKGLIDVGYVTMRKHFQCKIADKKYLWG